MLTGGKLAVELTIGESPRGFGRQRQAAKTMLRMWRIMVKPQNDAAASAEAVMSACHRCFE
jgi:hypothetical protein